MRIAVIVVVLLVIIAGAWGIRFETGRISVPVKCEVRCSAPEHQGDKLLRAENVEVMTTRWRADKVPVQEKTEVCAGCKEKQAKAVRLAREKAEREARMAAAKAKVDKMLQNLEMEFAVGQLGALYWKSNIDITLPCKVFPGDRIQLVFFFQNNTDKPIPANTFRAIVRTTGHIAVCQSDFYSWPRMTDVASGSAKWMRKLSGRGFPIPEIVPYNSPYYPGRNTQCEFVIKRPNDIDGSFTSSEWLAIDPEAKPGQSVECMGYLSVDGYEIQIATRTISIMYRQ